MNWGTLLEDYAIPFLTAALVFITGFYAIYTKRLHEESVRARKAAVQSELTISVVDTNNRYYLVLQNIGRRAAMNIKVTCNPPFQVNPGIMLGKSMEVFEGLAIDQERRYFVDTISNYWSKKRPEVYRFEIRWTCPVVGPQCRRIVIDMNTLKPPEKV